MSLKQPIRYPVKYYSHTDADAPQLADADGVIKTILKACLVTGYGTKEGAGWTSLFEDDFRIVLRRPLLTGNPPDIKIENGVINGAASHRIVSQDNPTGLDDATELTAVNLLARDSQHGNEWYLVASDVGFILCHQIGGGGLNQVLFFIETIQLDESIGAKFIINHLPNTTDGGLRSGSNRTIMSDQHPYRDMRSGADYTSKEFLNISAPEKLTNGIYLAQRAIIDNAFLLPFYVSLRGPDASITDTQITIDSRSALRFRNDNNYTAQRSLYIPLDYWEL